MDEIADAAAHEAEPVFRLMYRSRSLIPSARRHVDLAEVFTTARRNNRRLGVTGALMLSDDAFVQVLEGDAAVVRRLYATIAEDPRHRDVHLVSEEVAVGRTFGRWAMAKVAADGRADIRLMSNATKGVLVAVPDPGQAIGAEAEAVLATMRETLALDPA